MANDSTPFSDDHICDILVKTGLLSENEKKRILEKKDEFKGKVIRKQKLLHTKGRMQTSVTIIDIIAFLNLDRADSVPGKVDEEIIYQTLAREWGFQYKKINPLELDLNFVTTTLPRSFAMKHLTLPISRFFYELNEKTIDDIWKKNVPSDIISKLNGLKNRKFTNPKEFSEALTKSIGPVELEHYKTIIMHHSQHHRLVVATTNPFNRETLEDITRVSNMPVTPMVSSKSDIIKLINEFFGFKRSIVEAEQYFSGPSVDLGNLEQYARLGFDDDLPNDHHIVNAVNHLFTYAFDQRASDIHIEPKRETTLVRMRIDGVLHTVFKIPKSVHSAIISRIKNLSRMDMAEKRRPQDGRIKMDKGEIEVEIRISTVPVAFGEKMVMRIMDPNILFQDLETLGFAENDMTRFNKLIQMPHGIVIVCGPTGSGKSTTLYSALRKLSTPEINITTVEDPIEMIHEDFNQISAQSGLGISFGSILRNILRQDPDIIMIGEMRDLETAENAVQAALTGHLVLSTLHTNDAPSSITRLLDLGVPSFLIQSTLNGILAQRLVRKICNHCREKFIISTSDLKKMGITVHQEGNVTLQQGQGCQTCRETGYFGRTGIFEVLPYTESIKKMTTSETDLEAIRASALREGMVVLRENAVRKMLDGITTYHEVLRVTWEQT
jgi:general secretion pathway protein E